MSLCVFCQIAQGRAKSWVVHQSDDLIAFLPIKMDAPGHTIIAPIQHYASLIDAPASLGSLIVAEIQHLFKIYSEKLGATGFNLLQASGTSAQQSIAHLHFHLIPRSTNDGIDAWPKFNQAALSNDEMLAKIARNV